MRCANEQQRRCTSQPQFWNGKQWQYGAVVPPPVPPKKIRNIEITPENYQRSGSHLDFDLQPERDPATTHCIAPKGGPTGSQILEVWICFKFWTCTTSLCLGVSGAFQQRRFCRQLWFEIVNGHMVPTSKKSWLLATLFILFLHIIIIL